MGLHRLTKRRNVAPYRLDLVIEPLGLVLDSILATQAIRAGANRRVLERIKRSGDIFAAWSSEPWVLAGANVHVSFLCYDAGSEKRRLLDGEPVAAKTPT